jgi:predicted acyl esterase
VPSLGGTSLPGEGTGLFPGPADVRALAARDDVLTLVSAPLERPLTLAGRARVTLRVESDRPPCGLAARLAELAPDGELRVVADGVAVRDAPAGKPVALSLALSPAHHSFAPQHRVALLLSATERPRYLLGLDADRTLRIHVGAAAGSLLELPTEA